MAINLFWCNGIVIAPFLYSWRRLLSGAEYYKRGFVMEHVSAYFTVFPVGLYLVTSYAMYFVCR